MIHYFILSEEAVLCQYLKEYFFIQVLINFKKRSFTEGILLQCSLYSASLMHGKIIVTHSVLLTWLLFLLLCLKLMHDMCKFPHFPQTQKESSDYSLQKLNNLDFQLEHHLAAMLLSAWESHLLYTQEPLCFPLLLLYL